MKPMSDDHHLKAVSDPIAVPVFQCHVLVSRVEGRVIARCANLADLKVEAADERSALREMVSQFKAKVSEYERQEDIPWLDPISPADESESVRFLAVHL